MSRHYHRGEVRRRQIAVAALDIIAEHGLGGFTVRAVASRLPITDGTVFIHFRNKQEIVLAAMDLLEGELFSSSNLDEREPLARLKGFFEARARLLGGPRAIGRLAFSEELAQAAGAQGFERVTGWRRRSAEFVGECLDELAMEGRLRTDLPVAQLVRVVIGGLLTFSNERLLLNVADQLEQRVELSWSTMEKLLLSCTPVSNQ